MSIENAAACADCGTWMLGEPSERREPCPLCDSMRRVFPRAASDVLRLYERLEIVQKRKGHRRPIVEQIVGADLTRATGRYSHKERIVDRSNHRYRECVTDYETGQLIHLCDEDLRDHFGRGSAKPSGGDLPHEHIAVAAYYIWEKDGRPAGRDKGHWVMAIRNLQRAAIGERPLHS